MTFILALQSVALTAVAYAFLRHIAQREAQITQERRELLERIQRPELVPLHHRPDFLEPEIELDEIGLVGTIAPPPED